jgi:uncharacterized membrane protein (UPF0127 family)
MLTFRSSLLAVVVLLALSAQAPAAPSLPWCTRLPAPGAVHAPQCRLLEVRSARATLHLAVAANEAQREHGLMNVSFVPRNEGMIFVFPDGDQTRGFWMKDTITPLDMIFVRGDGTIDSVEANVPATPPKAPDDKIARRTGVGHYVIELGAGQAGALGLLPGIRLFIPPLTAE